MALSDFALDYTDIPVDSFIVEPGYDPTEVYPGQKIAKQCFYGSSPDRGLDILLGAWGVVHQAHPDATLLVTYGGEIDLPGVINLGEVDEATMNDVYRTSDIWAYPCTGIELYCMTGKKAQVAGCLPVIIPNMALKETVARGFMVDKPQDYAQSLIEVLNMPMKARDTARRTVQSHANALTWDQSTAKLFQIIRNVIQST